MEQVKEKLRKKYAPQIAQRAEARKAQVDWGAGEYGDASLKTLFPVKWNDIDDIEEPNQTFIRDLTRLGVFGPSRGSFNPDRVITRCEYAQWLYRSRNVMHSGTKTLKKAPRNFKQQFVDVPPNSPCYDAVQALRFARHPLTTGVNEFYPNQPLIREVMIGWKIAVDMDGVIMYYRGENYYGFSDMEQVDSFWQAHIDEDGRHRKRGKHGSNIDRAFGDLKAFEPQKAVTRKEAAATLWQQDYRGDVTAKKTIDTFIQLHGDPEEEG